MRIITYILLTYVISVIYLCNDDSAALRILKGENPIITSGFKLKTIYIFSYFFYPGYITYSQICNIRFLSIRISSLKDNANNHIYTSYNRVLIKRYISLSSIIINIITTEYISEIKAKREYL